MVCWVLLLLFDKHYIIQFPMLKELPRQKLLHLFDIIDFNHDGLLQKSDLYGVADNIDIFVNLLDGEGVHASLRTDADMMWEAIRRYFANPSLNSINKDRWLDFMEAQFFGADLRGINLNIERVVKRVRAIFDENHDGQLSKREFMVIFVSLRVQVRHANQCFEEIDANGDGFISDAELTKATKQFFRSNVQADCGNGLFGVVGSTHFSPRRSHAHA